MNNFTLICPYVFENEVQDLKNLIGWKVKSLFEKDEAGIGSDLMYQKLWKKCNPDDIFIMHTDMQPVSDDWIEHLLTYVNKYPEAGMFGCKLLYPKKIDDKDVVQSAGGKFNKNFPEHFGSGFDMYSDKKWKDDLVLDEGQFDCVREVAWTTFGGVYIRRELLNDVGDFDPSYEWSYNRDVDYCLQARKKNYKIYQVPVPIIHFESKDNKRLKNENSELGQKEARNLQKLINNWKKSGLMETIDIKV